MIIKPSENGLFRTEVRFGGYFSSEYALSACDVVKYRNVYRNSTLILSAEIVK